MKLINDSLKQKLENKNAKVIKKTLWLFLKRIEKIKNYIIIIGCSGFIILIWLNIIKIPFG